MGNKLKSANKQTVCSCQIDPHAQKLSFRRKNIGNDGFKQIVMLHLHRLKHLDISINNIDHKAFEYLQNSQVIKLAFDGLEFLSLQGNKITSASVRTIVKVTNCNLKTLNINGNLIDWVGIGHFSQGNWANLQRLYLGFNKLGSKGTRLLIKTQLPNLQWIELTRCQVQIASARLLSKMRLDKLKFLFASQNLIADQGIRHLSRMHFPLLARLFLNQNKITTSGAFSLSALPLKSILRIQLLLCNNENSSLVQASLTNVWHTPLYKTNYNNIFRGARDGAIKNLLIDKSQILF